VHGALRTWRGTFRPEGLLAGGYPCPSVESLDQKVYGDATVCPSVPGKHM